MIMQKTRAAPSKKEEKSLKIWGGRQININVLGEITLHEQIRMSAPRSGENNGNRTIRNQATAPLHSSIRYLPMILQGRDSCNDNAAMKRHLPDAMNNLSILHLLDEENQHADPLLPDNLGARYIVARNVPENQHWKRIFSEVTKALNRLKGYSNNIWWNMMVGAWEPLGSRDICPLTDSSVEIYGNYRPCIWTVILDMGSPFSTSPYDLSDWQFIFAEYPFINYLHIVPFLTQCLLEYLPFSWLMSPSV